MGDAKRKQYSRKAFLAEHQWCVYCGEAATTTDHCPPRCFFDARQWPESYEFPACASCNHEARQDELALAVIIRSDTITKASNFDQDEWQRLATGLRNNQPQMLREWTQITPSRRKKTFRETFGAELGDKLRHAGWGLASIGPLTDAAMHRFMVKLGKALYYKHNGALFEGVIYAHHINTLGESDPSGLMGGVLRIAPEFAQPMRNGKSLADQFIYRFNHSPEHGALYAVVRFSEQFIFQLIVLRADMANRLAAEVPQARGNLPTVGRYACLLKHKPT